MSAFDDEFGLFGEEGDEGERQPTLGARRISGEGERVVNDVEPENPRRSGNDRAPRAPRRDRAPQRRREAEPRPRNTSGDPWAGHRRATDLLGFVAKRLVAKPDDVAVELFTDESGKPVIELVVDPDDLGKVIGRNGRVAHALRTIVRATAEGRVSVDILDADEAAQGDDDSAGDE